MAIDPDLYEKVTGRSPNDTMNRYGGALAEGARARSRTSAAKDDAPASKAAAGMFFAYGWYRWLVLAGVAIGLIVIAVGR